MKQYDAILVLGTGYIKSHYIKRVEVAAKLYKQGAAPKIIFTGRWWGGLKYRPKITEARMMAKDAIKLGIPKKDILIEERSKSTLSNFYFTKQKFLKPLHFKKIAVILHPAGFEKAKFCSQKVLANKFQVNFISDGHSKSFKATKMQVAKGHKSTNDLKNMFKHIKDGDDKRIAEQMKQHPFYENMKLYDQAKRTR